MDKILALRLWLATGFILASPAVWAFDMGREDQQQHMAVSYAIATPTYHTLRAKNWGRWQSAGVAIGLTLIVGQTKELSDTQYDTSDMRANTIGALGGIILPLHFSF